MVFVLVVVVVAVVVVVVGTSTRHAVTRATLKVMLSLGCASFLGATAIRLLPVSDLTWDRTVPKVACRTKMLIISRRQKAPPYRPLLVMPRSKSC